MSQTWKLEIDHQTAYTLKDIMQAIVRSEGNGRVVFGTADVKIAKKLLNLLGEVPIPDYYYEREDLR